MAGHNTALNITATLPFGVSDSVLPVHDDLPLDTSLLIGYAVGLILYGDLPFFASSTMGILSKND